MKAPYSCFIILLAFANIAHAGDGFDVNYISGNANRIALTINGLTRNVWFGPGNLVQFNQNDLVIPNYQTYTYPDPINTLFISSSTVNPRVAYYDRVTQTKLFWRIYNEMSPPSVPEAEPSAFPNSVDLFDSTLAMGVCFINTVGNPWNTGAISVDVLNSLPQGFTYILEFFHISYLHDVGDETELLYWNCTQGGNSMNLCQEVDPQDRVLKSTYGLTDATTCNYYLVVAGQSHATKFRFGYGVATPLSWTAFSATRMSNDASLHWKTEQEFNLDRFIVERRGDGGGWYAVGEMRANNNFLPNTYAYLDPEVPQDALYYRLRAVDFDGTYEYSTVVALAAANGISLQLMPNPANGATVLATSKGAHVQIFDAFGHLMYNDPQADGQLRIETFDWPSGMYSVWVLAESGAALERTMLLVEH